jgi:hypothetical protein
MSKKLLILSSVSALVLSAACNDRGPTLAEQDPPPNRLVKDADFYGLVRRVVYNYRPFASETEMSGASDLVVKGRIVDVRRGRTLGRPHGVRGGQHTFVAEFETSSVVKGSLEGNRVFVEFLRSFPTTVEEVRAEIPDHLMSLYLLDVSKYLQHPNPEKRRQVFDEGAGLPSKETPLYALNTPQGMVVETPQGMAQPLTDRLYWLIPRALQVPLASGTPHQHGDRTPPHTH